MPQFLNERQIGFDTTKVGFPELGDCMGLALQNSGGIFGFHLMPGDGSMSAEFVRYFTAHVGFNGTWTHLYGSCYRPRRYGSTDSAVALSNWKTEMTNIAQAIGYNGPVSGFDTSQGTSIKRSETTYVEYRVGGGGACTIHYKRMSKMDHVHSTATIPATENNIALIRPDKAAQNALGRAGLPVVPVYMQAKNSVNLSTDATVKQTRSNKGELHAAKTSAIDSFTV